MHREAGMADTRPGGYSESKDESGFGITCSGIGFGVGFISSGFGIECAIPILNPHVLNQ